LSLATTGFWDYCTFSGSDPASIVPLSIPLTRSDFFNVCRNVLLNQAIVITPFAFVYYAINVYHQKYLGWLYPLGARYSRDLPPWTEVVWQIGVSIPALEAMFYFIHKAFHRYPTLYRFHKQHHEFTSPIALCAIYAHPLEIMLNNMTPVGLCVLVCRFHLVTSWLWFVLVLSATLIDHSGYRWPFIPRWDFEPNYHDWHHEKYTGPYGFLGFLDRVFKDDTDFRQHWRRLPHLSSSAPAASVVNDSANGSTGKLHGHQS